MEKTAEFKLYEKLLDEFVETEVKPRAAEVDELEIFPVDTVKKMGEIGLMGICVPKEYGGAGASVPMYAHAVRKISSACASTGVILSAHFSLCVTPILEYGTPEQKAKYLPKLCSGEHVGAFGLTEPNAGTDASGQQTLATEVEDGWILNGSKIFITNAGYADIFIIFAMTDRNIGVKSITAFILERGTPGFTVGKPENKMGIRGSSTCELIFDNVHLGKDALLGKVGQGFPIAMKTLDGGRVGIAAQAVGIAEGAINETIKYVKERKQFNRPIAAFQNTQFVLASLYAKTQAAALLVEQAAEAKEQKLKDLSLKAAMAKLVGAEVAMEVTTKCLQLFGGYGYTRDYPIERMMRDAKITEIYEGTSEVQRMVIAGAILR